MKEYCIDSTATVQEAMKTIDNSEPQIVFVLEGKRILASLTDGDIRRFLLKGGSLKDLALLASNQHPLTAKNEEEAQKLYHRKNYVAIPILDENDEFVEIYIGKETHAKKKNKINIPVVINAGGKGTRLEPFTKILPKPLIPVGEKPIIEHIMDRFMEYECDAFHIIVNYKKELLKAYFLDEEKRYAIQWYEEQKPLGTGGGLCFLKGKMTSTFFFTNCDNLLLSDYESIYRFHKENNNMITMICAYKNLIIPYGVVEMGVNGSILSMTEKPEMSFLTNTGIYVVEPEVINDIEDNVSISFPDIIDMQRKKGNKVAVYPVGGNDWLDMGQLNELEKMGKRLYGEDF